MKISENQPGVTLKKFARGLMTTTCLTAAATAMQASTINETSVAGADFGNTFAVRNDLGAGVTEVIGAINPTSDVDWFRIDGLTAGSTFTINGVFTGGARYGIFDNANVNLVPLATNPGTMTGTVPTDGILVVQVIQNEALATYDLTLGTTAGTPEPSTFGGMALALAGGLTLRRRYKK